MEVWIDIPGYPNHQASSEGQIRSLFKNRVKILSPLDNGKGYKQFSVYHNGRSKKLYIHITVATAFRGPFDGWVNHEDGNKSNNRLSNLEWTTPKKNHEHRVNILGKHRRGEHCTTSKLTTPQVRGIRMLVKFGVVQRRVAEWFGINYQHVSSVVLRHSWNYI